ncbi:MAG: hypothetical protein HKM06_03375 [Spirochaetales bacterium]|nr:hypothetical protein [Spirochaetales bacterium]
MSCSPAPPKTTASVPAKTGLLTQRNGIPPAALPLVKPPLPPKATVPVFDASMLRGKEFLLQVRTPEPGPSESYEDLGPLAGNSQKSDVRAAESFLQSLVEKKIAKAQILASWREYLSNVLSSSLKAAGKLTGWRLGAWMPGSDETTKIAPFLLLGKGEAHGIIYLVKTSFGWRVSDVQGDLSQAEKQAPQQKFDPVHPLPFDPLQTF